MNQSNMNNNKMFSMKKKKQQHLILHSLCSENQRFPSKHQLFCIKPKSTKLNLKCKPYNEPLINCQRAKHALSNHSGTL